MLEEQMEAGTARRDGATRADEAPARCVRGAEHDEGIRDEFAGHARGLGLAADLVIEAVVVLDWIEGDEAASPGRAEFGACCESFVVESAAV